MPVEIERKFLVTGDSWRSQAKGSLYRQGYLTQEPGRTVRVRIAGDRGFLTIKGPTQGVTRSEFEYAIPVSDAREMLETLCVGPLIEKTRYTLEHNGLIWEIDEFAGENQGLILAEVELTEANQSIQLPEWVGTEVSHDPRYFNANLARHPYRQWNESAERTTDAP